MKPVLIILSFFVLGVAGAWLYLRSTPSPAPPISPSKGMHVESDGHLHGGAPASQAKLCVTHRIPESVDAFCHPDLIERLGFCQGHNVPEAFCTRCSPVLIAAFKVEGDWCDEHAVPESQCESCQGQSPPSGTG